MKYDVKKAKNIIELYGEGCSLIEISKLLNISRMTLNRWIKNYKLQSLMDKERGERVKHSLRHALVKLATGDYEEGEVTREYIEEEGSKTIKVTEKLRKFRPDSKAITILARAYDKELLDSNEDSPNSGIILNVNTSTMSLRELQNSSRNDSPLGGLVDYEVEYSERL